MDVEQAILIYVVLVISLVVHEVAHGLVAKWGGDSTAYDAGLVTLNPIPHMQREPTGMIMMPLLMLLASRGTMCFGGAHVPIDANWAYRNPRRAALVSIAGPVANFLLVGVAFLVLKGLVLGGYATSALNPIDDVAWVAAVIRIGEMFIFLNLILGIFNLIPWPPLDGAAVLEGLFPKQFRPFYNLVRNPIWFIVLIIAIWQLGLIEAVVRPILNAVFRAI